MGFKRIRQFLTLWKKIQNTTRFWTNFFFGGGVHLLLSYVEHMEISIKITPIIAYNNALFSVFNHIYHIFVNQIWHKTDKFVGDFYKFAATNKRELFHPEP
jgi:hypothetical protein